MVTALLVAFSGSVVVAGAAPSANPHGLARGHAHHSGMVTPVGPEEGAENAAVAVPHGAAAIANSLVVAQPGENGDDDLSAAAGIFVSDLGPRRFARRVAIESPEGTTPATPAAPGAAPAAQGGTVSVPLTGPSAPAAETPAQRSARRSTGGAPARGPSSSAPSLPNLPIIPPASLPAPAQFVPAVTGLSIAPVIGLVVCLVALGALIGIRVARRPG